MGAVSGVCALSEGCSIIQASSSMMSEAVIGQSADEMAALASRFDAMMRAKPETPAAGFGDLDALAVVREYPVRIKCALLPWTALEIGLSDYHAGR